MKEQTNIRLAIVATIFTAVIFLFLFLFIGINNRRYAYDDSKKLASEVSRKAVLETEIYLNNAINVARTLKDKSLLLKKANVERSFITEIIKDALIANPNFLAVWTMWEHNAFDNKDDYYKNTIGNDSQGNISTTFFKYKDTILLEETQPDDYLEDYYTIPRRTKSELFMDPYYYQYEGFSYIFYEISIVVPIIIDTTFAGVFGVDINLDGLLKILKPVKLYKSGYLCLIANSGVIVSHADTSFIKKNISDIISKNEVQTYEAIKQGKELALETISEFTGEKVFRYFYPISSSENIKPWSMMVEIPIEEATTRSKQLLYIAFGILIVGLSLLLYLVINIYERKKYEQEILTAKRKAEESNRLKTAFLNNISHEIRTPLNGILGFSELLIDSDLDDEHAVVYKNIIHNSSNQLLSIISNIIELSKIQSSKVERIIKEFEINNAIQKVVDSFKPAINEKGLKLILNISENNKNKFIRTDEDKFKQVLSYLINNAIKFTEKGSIEVGFFDQESTYLFYVMDTGIGIKPENYNNIFKYFNQEDSTMTRNFGGLGVGLSITKSYVDLLGGSIRFESEVGKGTTFYFNLPNLQLNTDDIKNRSNKVSKKHTYTILIVEDEKTNYILLNEILVSSGVKTIWAQNGEEAVKLCKLDDSIKLIFMDIKMPVMNGFEAAQLIKSDRKDIPIIALTGNYTTQEVGDKICFDSIITKPFKKEDLIRVLKMANLK
ncbi:MAG: ATP-binding protein [Bacteroidales bacterium]